MATPPSFQKAEDEYFLLKGKLQAGRITRAQFDAALKQLMVQDTQGRYWTIGADDGKWYVHDGRAWVEAPLPSAAMPPPPPPPMPSASPSPAQPSPSPAFSQPAAPPPKRSVTGILFALGVIVVLCLLAALAGAVVVGGGLLRLSMSAPTNTPFIVFAVATPVPVAISPAVPSVVAATASPASIRVPTAVEPAKPSPALQATVTQTLAPMPTATPAGSPIVPTATSAPAPPTPAPTVPTAAPASPTVPAVPPGLYVTGIQLDPPEVKDRQTPTFHVTFLNTLGQTVYYRWFVKIYEPEKRQSFGETAKLDSTFPDGTTTVASIANWRAVGGSPCRPFIARVFYEAPDKTILEFPKPGGDSYYHYFAVCPAN